MCGIFGVVATPQSTLSTKELKRISRDLFLLSESRGREAAGIAVVKQKEISVFKSPRPASQLIKDAKFRRLWDSVSLPTAFVGHARLVTNGSMESNANNQPVIKNGIVAVHNGIIVNDEKLWQKHAQLHRDFEVDTEVLLALVAAYRNAGQTIAQALSEAYNEVEGTASVALLFEERDVIALATNNGSLHMIVGDGFVIFASERLILGRLAHMHAFLRRNSTEQLAAGRGCVIDLATAHLTRFNLGGKELGGKDEPSCKRSIVDSSATDVPQVHRLMPRVQLRTDILKEEERVTERIQKLRRCSRCILPETVPFVTFDTNGVCSVCRRYQKSASLGRDELEVILAKHRKSDGTPDCAVMFSGGRDSSYGLHLLRRKYGMNPVAYTYDWGMITDLGRRNQARMSGALGVEHILISADIKKKRENIRKNVLAWLKRPDLGMVPIFMAGDKQFFYHANRLRINMGIDLVIMLTNPLEKTSFKSGFCDIPPRSHTYHLGVSDAARLGAYYAKQYAQNPAYINSSLVDSFSSYLSYYFIPHDYLQFFDYVNWNEEEINTVLRHEYDWELAPDAETTWRIGDGTAPFYNYIYFVVAGFTENDAFRSNQVREGVIDRNEALRLAARDNYPRHESMRWYFDTIGLDMNNTLARIHEIPKRYEK